jgi:hypothetical protein
MKRKSLSGWIKVALLACACATTALGLFAETTGASGASRPAARLPESVAKLPSESQFVFGINMKKAGALPSLAGFRQAVMQQMGKDLGDFVGRTGVDPSRDISYIVGAGRIGADSKSHVAFILTGKFDSNAIAEFLRARVNPVEVKYAGTTVLMIADKQSDTAENGFALRSDSEIIGGDLAIIKAILDVNEKKSKNVMSNLSIAPMLAALNPDEMMWIVGDVSKLLKNTEALSQVLPIAPILAPVKTATGTLAVADSVSGKIIAKTDSADSAAKVTEGIQALIALGQLMAGQQPPIVKRMFNGMTVAASAAQVRINFNWPIEMLTSLLPK